METFYLTGKEMASLLLSLQGKTSKSPLATLQEAWIKSHKSDIEHGKSFAAFISTSLPPIFEKMIRSNWRDVGFSLTDIVSLGNQIEYTNFSVTSIQNWVKRDIKERLGGPRLGKKYSIDQAALLFFVDDLKTTLDFEAIRQLLDLIFHNPNDDADDLLSPAALYASYSSLFEELDQNNDQLLDVQGHDAGKINQDHMLEGLMKRKSEQYAQSLTHLNKEQQDAVSHILVIAMVSVQAAYLHSIAKRFLNATLFLHDLK